MVGTDPVPNPYFTKWRSDGDADAYAAAYAAFVRGFTESSLRENLFVPGTRGAAVDDLVDAFFARLTARFAADPERDRFEDWTLTVVLGRRRVRPRLRRRTAPVPRLPAPGSSA